MDVGEGWREDVLRLLLLGLLGLLSGSEVMRRRLRRGGKTESEKSGALRVDGQDIADVVGVGEAAEADFAATPVLLRVSPREGARKGSERVSSALVSAKKEGEENSRRKSRYHKPNPPAGRPWDPDSPC
jgi:hypothetical protein